LILLISTFSRKPPTELETKPSDVDGEIARLVLEIKNLLNSIFGKYFSDGRRFTTDQRVSLDKLIDLLSRLRDTLYPKLF
jgi:hypothetical protein